jgi:hypothetical protein
MPSTLTKDQRSALEKLTLRAREAAETAARTSPSMRRATAAT